MKERKEEKKRKSGLVKMKMNQEWKAKQRKKKGRTMTIMKTKMRARNEFGMK